VTVGASGRSYSSRAGDFTVFESERWTPARQARTAPAGLSVEWAVVTLTAGAILAVGMISPELLTAVHVHYISSGGGFYEKLHPATYLAVAAFLLLLMRGGDPVGELNRILPPTRLLLVYFFACALLALQCVVLKRPFTSVIDTFLLPALLCLIIWNLTPAQRKPLIVAIHIFIWINIALGFYEYFSKHRLVPITVGKLIVTGDWRSTALLGHPLAAAGVVAMYIMALVLRPKTQSPYLLMAPAVLIATGSLMVFGGRTALVAVMVVFAGVAIGYCARLVRGAHVGLMTVILATCGIMLVGAAIPIMFATGVFDSMITRFSSDNGSAHARIASMHLLYLFDWKELLLGTSAVRSTALQSMMGLDFGVENFWIACIVQYGIIQTALITIGLACFFAVLLKRSTPAAWVTVLFLCLVAASSVSFSSKNISLAAYVAIIALMLPRAPAGETARAPLRYRGRSGVAYAPVVPVR